MKSLIATIIASLFVASFFTYGQNNDERTSVPAPAAVPVVSVEEAREANTEALKEASKIAVSGTITAISHTISPETAAYDDCNFTLLLNAKDGNEYVITVPMFIKRQFTPFARMKVGGMLDIRMIPFEETSNEIQEIQTVDDINDFEKEMYYADTIESDSINILVMDPEKNEIWRKKLLQETELQLSKYDKLISENMDEREKEIEDFKKKTFRTVQKPYGYFVESNYYVLTTHYNPTLLTGLKDLSEKCRSFHCELLVVPCISLQEYSRTELIHSLEDFPFVDFGREKLICDCLNSGILALDTNLIIRNHQSSDYLPYSLLGDNHFSCMTNAFIADEIASKLGIRKNDYKIKKDYFKLSSRHIPSYSGPSIVQADLVFEKQLPKQTPGEAPIIVAGDSFATTNNFHNYISSMTMCDVKPIRHDARSNTTLKELLEGKYDSELQKASLLVFIFSSLYITGNYPTQELVDIQSQIKSNKIRFSNIPVTDSQKTITIKRPKGFPEDKPLKALIEMSSIIAKYTLKANRKQTVFEYDCCVPLNGGDNSFVLDLKTEQFIDGQVELSIEGNTSFKKIVLVEPSE